MKKEFGKWFLDLAKYILTAIILSAFFADMEQGIVLWGALVFFLVSIIIGYILLVQADKENRFAQEVPQSSSRVNNNKKKSNKKPKK